MTSRLDEIAVDIKSAKHEINELRNSVQYSQVELDRVVNQIQNIEKMQSNIAKNATDIAMLQDENVQLKQKLERYESYSRRDNLVVCGLEETEDEDVESVTQQFFQQLLKEDYQPIPVVRSHRLGSRSNAGNGKQTGRPFIIRFQSYSDRTKIWNKRQALQGTNLWLKEDFPVGIEQNRKRLYPILKEARSKGMKASLSADRLRIDGKFYTVNDLDSLPKELHPENLSVRETNKHVLFFGRYTAFSNFHPCQISMRETVYSCVEQAFQHQKALAANDLDTASKIMGTADPVAHKRWGDNVKMKKYKQWLRSEGLTIMQDAVLSKFSQHEDFKLKLLATQGKCLVECNPHDKFWSCGMRLSDSNAVNPSNWSGENRLGMCLDEARRSLS